MCGRYTQTRSTQELRERFGAIEARAEVAPRYNVAPTDPVPVIVREPQGPVLVEMRWGLVPSWSSPGAEATPRPINAKAETLSTSGMFKRLLGARRCLVAADGFYEWSGPRTDRRPARIRLHSGETFAFAGLWDAWRDPRDRAAPPLLTCTIVTTAANELVRPLHDRMPVILLPEDEGRWLEPSITDPRELAAMLGPYPSDLLAIDRVSTLVNDVRNQGPDCILPLS
ncbi:MAG: SOS response-associated peptidase [Myxococcales bacterium]|jgi:putative SOS response-associated peptidase YedK